SRAVRLIKQLDSAESGYRELIERELASRLGKAGASSATKVAPYTDQAAPAPVGRDFLGPPKPEREGGSRAAESKEQEDEKGVCSKVVGTVNTDENGRAEFSGIAGVTRVKAVATVEGERLESEEFPAPTQGGIRLLLVATLKGAGPPAAALQPVPGMAVLGDQTRVIFDLADNALQVYYLLDFENTARAPVMPASAVALDLPKDAQGASILAGAPQAIARGSRVTVTGPFAPGQTEVQVGYQLPYSGGDAVVTQKFPVPVGNIAVLMKKVGEMSLASPQLP